jgi:hypothetical protein
MVDRPKHSGKVQANWCLVLSSLAPDLLSMTLLSLFVILDGTGFFLPTIREEVVSNDVEET